MTKTLFTRFGVAVLLIAALSACGGGGGGGGGGEDGREIADSPSNAPSSGGGGGTVVGIGMPAGGGAAGQAAFETSVYPLTRQYCVQCHAGSGPGFPHLAHPDVETAFRAVVDNQKVNLTDPTRSRLVRRLLDDQHFCWNNDCPASGAAMLAAVETWADAVAALAPDPNAVNPVNVIHSAGTSFMSATRADSTRNEADTIAFWKFEEGTGTEAADISSIGPTMNLTLEGDVTWVSGGGLNFDGGHAISDPVDSRKLHNEIASGSGTQEYSVEVWVIPANTTQENRPMFSYSQGNARNFAVSQQLYNYVFRARTVDPLLNQDGDPALRTNDDDEDLQANLQHAVVTYDQARGRRIFVNGVFTDDEDEIAPGMLFNWNPDYTFVVGSETGGNRAWRGVVRMLSIRNRVMSQNAIMQNFLAGAAQQYRLRFDLSDTLGGGAWVEFTVSEFDAYSYLFCAPLLDSGGRSGFTVQTIRIAVNGVPPVASQAFRTLNQNIMQSSTQLSMQCQVVPKDLGIEQDVFHVFFDVLGDLSNPIADLPPSPPPSPTVVEPSPGIGIRDFAEINDTLAEVTGVPVTNTGVRNEYLALLQQLPSDNDPRSFVSAQQVGISRLSLDYCDQLVESNALRPAYFPGFDFTRTADVAFDTAVDRNRIIDPLAAKMLGTDLGVQPTADEVRPILNNLIDELVAGCSAATCPASHTRNVVKGVCAAVLSSGAVQLH